MRRVAAGSRVGADWHTSRVLQVGLTGGIGAGKSAVSAALATRGAAVVDADGLAREVVAPGTSGLSSVLAEFGPSVLLADGSLDRPALGRVVFADGGARERLNAIVHPLVAARTAELVAALPAGAVVVHDVPLLVENRLGAAYHLVVVVGAAADVRVRRLVASRGMTEGDARARLAAQTDDAARRAAADVWLENTAGLDALHGRVDALWRDRLVPYEENVRLGRPAARPDRVELVPYDPSWPTAAGRLAARVAAAAGGRGLAVDHVGSTAVPGLTAKDVVDLQLTVASMADADAVAPGLAAAGFPAVPGIRADRPKPSDPDPARWAKRFHRSADPGRALNLHVRVGNSAGRRYALLVRDWLRADADARAGYAGEKQRLARDVRSLDAYVEAKEPWFDAALPRAEAWAAAARWAP